MSRDPAARVRAYLTEPVTYEHVGATAGELPAGFHHVRRAQLLGHGRERFEWAAQQVLTFQVQRRAGLDVASSSPEAAPGVVVLVGLRLGPLRMVAPCRVVAIVDEQDAKGFAYGTLPGHPEHGEERFTVTIDGDDCVVLHIVAFSRPATWWSRAGAPVAARIQRRTTTRYLNALVD